MLILRLKVLSPRYDTHGRNRKENMLFTVIFEDNTSFNGGDDYFDTKWLEIPKKKIRTIFYRMPIGDLLCLTNYDSYCHYVEGTHDLNGEKAGETVVAYDYLLARLGNKVVEYKMNVKNCKIDINTYEISNERISKLNKDFWR